MHTTRLSLRQHISQHKGWVKWTTEKKEKYWTNADNNIQNFTPKKINMIVPLKLLVWLFHNECVLILGKSQQRFMTQMSNRSQISVTCSKRCHGLVAKTSYCVHITVKPWHCSTRWMSDQNESSHGFTSFEFMHGEACQGREMMWTLALTVCQNFTSLPLSARLKLVICYLTACHQCVWDSWFNICGLLAGINAIRWLCGRKESFCTHLAIYHFNEPRLSQGTCLHLAKTVVWFLFHISNSYSKLVIHQWPNLSHLFCLFGKPCDRNFFKKMFWYQMK